MVFAVSLLNYFSSSAAATNISGTSPTPDNIVVDLALSSTADKAVKAILPFLKELSEADWWTGLLAAWINFEVKEPPKSVRSFLLLI